jgi:hypothetical protein
MGKFIEETYSTIEDRVNRWETIGMLDTVKSNDSKKLVATALDATAIYITESNFMNFDKDTKTVLIPVMVRIFNKTNKDFTLEILSKSVRAIIEDFAKKYSDITLANWKKGKGVFEGLIDEDLKVCRDHAPYFKKLARNLAK